MLQHAMLPTLWEQFGEGPFLFQHDCAPVHKARSMKSLDEFGVEELDWPDLNPFLCILFVCITAQPSIYLCICLSVPL